MTENGIRPLDVSKVKRKLVRAIYSTPLFGRSPTHGPVATEGYRAAELSDMVDKDGHALLGCELFLGDTEDPPERYLLIGVSVKKENPTILRIKLLHLTPCQDSRDPSSQFMSVVHEEWNQFTLVLAKESKVSKAA